VRTVPIGTARQAARIDAGGHTRRERENRRKKVEEPPANLVNEPQGRPPAKRQRVNNASTRPSRDPASALDHVELDLIKYPEGVRGPSTINLSLNTFLLNDFGKPENLIKAIKLLSNVSRGAANPSIDLSSILLALEVRGNHLVPNLIATSFRANAHLDDLEKNATANRLKTILSYIIHFLTLEYAIVPELRKENPTQTLKWIEGQKYQYFADMLNAAASSVPTEPEAERKEITGIKVRKHRDYGRVFWEYGQALGIASLLVFAVSDIGLSRVGSSSRAGIPQLAADLSTDNTWWAFAHSISPPTFRTLFGSCNIAYSVPELLNRIRREPISPTTTIAINKEYNALQIPASHRTALDLESEVPTAVQGRNWEIAIGEQTLPVKRHPTAQALVSENMVRRNLGNWLKNTPGDEIVEDSNGNSTPFHAFKSLLAPSDISHDLIDFLTNVFNARAIPGRIALPVAHGVLASFGGTLEEFLNGLSAPPGGVPERVLCPFDVEEATIGIVIAASASTIIVYNWVNKHNLADEVVQVFS